MVAREQRSLGETCTDVVLGEMRVLGEEFCDRQAVSEQPEDDAHGDAGALHYRLAERDVGVAHDPLDRLSLCHARNARPRPRFGLLTARVRDNPFLELGIFATPLLLHGAEHCQNRPTWANLHPT